MDVEDDLRPRRRPLQVPSHSNPQLVDVGVLAVVGGDGQGVGDGQQLQGGESHTAINIPRRRSFRLLAGSQPPTFCGASCSGTSQSSSEAAGSCMPSNCRSKPIATESAELDWRKDLDLENTPVFINSISKFKKPKNKTTGTGGETAFDWSQAWLTHIDSELRKDLLLELTLRLMSASGREPKEKNHFLSKNSPQRTKETKTI